MRIAVLGQGIVGTPLASYLEKEHEVIRYSLELNYVGNKEKVRTADVCFICVPSPTYQGTQNLEAIISALTLCSGIAVIKSTILPGTCRVLQKQFPNLTIMHSPEFLRERFAKTDTLYPDRNVIGCAKKDKVKAKKILNLLPKSKHNHVVSWETAECSKYASNIFLTAKVVYANLMHDFAHSVKGSGKEVLEIMGEDERIGNSHLKINERGRGAGGHCLIKDLSAFRGVYDDPIGNVFFSSLEAKNKQYLLESHKDTHILSDIFGASITMPSDQGTELEKVAKSKVRLDLRKDRVDKKPQE